MDSPEYKPGGGKRSRRPRAAKAEPAPIEKRNLRTRKNGQVVKLEPEPEDEDGDEDGDEDEEEPEIIEPMAKRPRTRAVPGPKPKLKSKRKPRARPADRPMPKITADKLPVLGPFLRPTGDRPEIVLGNEAPKPESIYVGWLLREDQQEEDYIHIFAEYYGYKGKPLRFMLYRSLKGDFYDYDDIHFLARYEKGEKPEAEKMMKACLTVKFMKPKAKKSAAANKKDKAASVGEAMISGGLEEAGEPSNAQEPAADEASHDIEKLPSAAKTQAEAVKPVVVQEAAPRGVEDSSIPAAPSTGDIEAGLDAGDVAAIDEDSEDSDASEPVRDMTTIISQTRQKRKLAEALPKVAGSASISMPAKKYKGRLLAVEGEVGRRRALSPEVAAAAAKRKRDAEAAINIDPATHARELKATVKKQATEKAFIQRDLTATEKDLARTTEILKGLELDNKTLRKLLDPVSPGLDTNEYKRILDGTHNNGMFRSRKPKKLITIDGKKWGQYTTLRLLHYHFPGTAQPVVFNGESLTKITTKEGKDVMLTQGDSRVVTVEGYKFHENSFLMEEEED